MDQSLFHLINGQWTSPLLDLFMAALSDSKIWEPLFVAVGVSALFFGGFRGRAFVICLALSLLITNELIDVLKSAVDRPRPKQVENVRMVELQRTHPPFLTLFKKPTIRFSDSSDRNQSGPSFPSGHGDQHDNCRFLHAVLSAARLALLVHHCCRRLFANLSRLALAQRCDRHIFSQRW